MKINIFWGRIPLLLLLLHIATFMFSNNLLPNFSAKMLSKEEAKRFLPNAFPSEFFVIETKEIVELCKKNSKQNISFTLSVGDYCFDLDMHRFDEKISGVATISTNSNVFLLEGVVRNSANSRVCIWVSPQSFYVSIVQENSRVQIENAKIDGKAVPDIFAIYEAPFEQIESIQPATSCPIIFSVDIGIQVDQLFVDHFSNFNDPLTEALGVASSSVNGARTIWHNIFSNLDVNKVFYAEPSQNGDLYNLNFATWSNNILGDWTDTKPCIKKDGIIYFTGHTIGVNGVTNLPGGYLCSDPDKDKGSRVAIIGGVEGLWNPDIMQWTVAHEIGHFFGLPHEDVTDCGSSVCDGNPETNNLMCNGAGRVKEISSCLISIFNNHYNAGAGNCDCMEHMIPFFPDNNCPRCYAEFTIFTNDNPNPRKSCGQDKDVMNFYAKVEGGCSDAIGVHLRSRFRGVLAQIVVDKNGRFSDYFTHTRAVADGFIELFACENPNIPFNPTTNPEKKVDIDDITDFIELNFKLRYTENSGLIEGINYPVYVYINDFASDAGNRSVAVKPFYTRTITPGQSIFSVIDKNTDARRFVIHGDINLSPQIQSVGLGGYLYQAGQQIGYNFNGFEFKFATPDVNETLGDAPAIYVQGGTKLKLTNATIEGCEQMWTGIDAIGSVEITSSTIKDAQAALEVRNSTLSAEVRNSTFENNNFGIRANITPHAIPLTFVGNTFKSAGAFKSMFANQRPEVFANKGLVGIHVVGGFSVNIDKSNDSDNYFEDLHNGIVAINSNVSVKNTYFENILQIPGSPALPGVPLNLSIPSGKGIFTYGGRLTEIGAGISASNPNTFTNCHTGIQSMESDIFVTSNKMTGVNTGIRANVNFHKKISISFNDISAKEYGINAFHLTSLSCIVSNNIVRMQGSDNAWGIQTGMSGFQQQTGGIFENNEITLNNGIGGINVGVSKNIKTIGNKVHLLNNASRFGIYVMGGDQNNINCNDIDGLGNEGISSVMTGRSSFICNSIEGTNLGLHFDGVSVGKSNNNVAGNLLTNNLSAGLVLGADAVIGKQLHRGNEWSSNSGVTFAEHLNPFLAIESEFIVDPAEDNNFLPTTHFPGNWFSIDNNPLSSFVCLAGATCPAPTNAADTFFVKKIAKSQVTGFENQIPQLWLAQRRLYERLVQDGNPFPGNSDINTFFAQAQSSGMQGYGNLQIGIRQMLNLSSSDWTILDTYSSQISQKLDQVAQKEAAILIAGTNPVDSSQLASERDSLIQDISAISTQRANKFNSLTNAKNGANNALIAQNNALSAASPAYMVNEKIVNSVILQIVGSGVNRLDSAQFIILQAIANQCALSGGEAVLVARDLLAMSSESPVFFDDEDLCNSSPRAYEHISPEQDASLQIYPNPANENIIIQYDFQKDGLEKLQFFNIFGQLESEIQLPNKTGSLMVSVKSWQSGTYFYTLSGNPGISGKIVVNK